MATYNTINDVSSLNSNLPAYSGGGKPHGEIPPSPSKMPQDRVTLSKAALAQKGEKPNTSGSITNSDHLSTEEKQVVNDLKRRDAEVKSHEAAHMSAGGGIVQGGASYEYQSGPDGKMYAVGGEVQIDVTPERTPEGTIRKMQQIRAAALAPAQPSGTDRAVAAQASQIEAQARMEKNQADKESPVKPIAAAPHSGHPGMAKPMKEDYAVGAHIDFTV